MIGPRSAFGAPPRGGAGSGPAKPDPRPPGSVWRKVALMAAAAVVLAAVFMAYLNPHLAVDLANRVWACF
jgi:hypothetical protein